jgi:dCMP deaminase
MKNKTAPARSSLRAAPAGPKERPGWDEYFIGIAQLVSHRSTCMRRAVGAVLVKDKRILTTGYNGAPGGLKHCEETGCMREKMKVPSGERAELCRGLHAEQNAIIQAALHGVPIKGSTIYITNQPCSICVKMMINAGIEKVIYLDGYPDTLARQLLEESEIEVIKYEEEKK